MSSIHGGRARQQTETGLCPLVVIIMSIVKGNYIICKKYHFHETPLGGPSNLTCCILYFVLLILGEQLFMYLKIIEILKKCDPVT